MSPSGDLLVFYWLLQQDWQLVNVSQIAGQQIASPLTRFANKRESSCAGENIQGRLFLACLGSGPVSSFLW